jgi:5'-nucleotidase
MINKFTLLIDQDGVLAEWYQGLLDIYRKRYPDRPYVKPEDLTQFYAEELYPEEHRADVMAIAREKGFYLSLSVTPGAKEALEDIEKNCLEFINPFICTSPEVEFEDLMCHSEKVQWTRDNLSDFWVKQTIITKDKTVVRGDILIDDKPFIKGSMEPLWVQMPFDRPYTDTSNMRIQHKFNWSQWPKLRDSIKQEVLGVTS